MEEIFPATCVAPAGEFVYGIHKQRFTALNLRQNDHIVTLGCSVEREPVENAANFPAADIQVESSSWIFEIPNAFPFMGATFIIKSKADQGGEECNPFAARKSEAFSAEPDESRAKLDLRGQPQAALLALARTSTDPELLAALAELSCRFIHDHKSGLPSGMLYEKTAAGELRPLIVDPYLFDLVSNNPSLPDLYKKYMVLLPGVQGPSPIVGEYSEAQTHIWEYLRENSYIPWGHYAANMAEDAVRYRIRSLSAKDITGLRHLYYQRVYVQLAAALSLAIPARRRALSEEELERLRLCLLRRLREGAVLPFNASIWGQNFGADISASGYRLNASHQQLHQQFALVPPRIPAYKNGENRPGPASISTYLQGDLVARFTREYKEKTGRDFFDAYLQAIGSNRRLDGRADRESDLRFYQDEKVIAFVPKAQRSPGEIQIMTKGRCGNILEADSKTRQSLDLAILVALRVLENLGVEFLNAFEISKRFDNPDSDQRLLYCFLPRHPQSPGSFSEFQQRWISNHYPEDFARSCRLEVEKILVSALRR